MIHGSKVQINCSLFFLSRKHYCPKCRGTLERKKHETIVHSESAEAKDYDFSMGDTFLYGNIKFITYCFECPKCKTIYEIRELKEIEKAAKKAKDISH
jgi:uncharacterized protein YbaR (Trm112 family)